MTKIILGKQAIAPADLLAHRPIFFRLGLPDDRLLLEALLTERPAIVVHDTIEEQVAELVRCRQARPLATAALRDAVRAELAGRDPETYGVWVYYPWSRRLVHTLEERDFILVRTSRNQHKITSEERDLLAGKKVGVIGLSVGQAVALTLALERACGQLRLADPDRIDLSNLNRLRTGLHTLAVPKVIAAAQEIAEIDPYLDVVLFSEGLSEANLDSFFLGGAPLDLVIEECDSLEIKVRARLKARELGIAVVMDTSDGGLLDVERFDLEPGRPLLHGLVGDLEPEQLRGLPDDERVALAMALVGADELTPRMKASVIELGQTVGTWPQLASAVAHGAGATADVTRRILLRQHRSSGRFRLDLDKLVCDPPVQTKTAGEPPAPPAILGPVDGLGPPPADVRRPDMRVIEEIVAAAGRAPSLGNDQPWRWRWSRGRLILLHDRGRSCSYGDVEQMSAWVSLGAALENAVLHAQALGYGVRVVEPAGPAAPFAAALELVGKDGPGSEPHHAAALAVAIDGRFTSRSRKPPPPVDEDGLARLRALAGDQALHFRSSAGDLQTLARLSGRADQLRLLHPDMHADLFGHEVDLAPHPGRTDGIPVDNLVLRGSERVLLQLLRDPAAAQLLRGWRLGAGLAGLGAAYLEAASNVGFLVVPSYQPRDLLAAGRALERIWLQATLLGIGLMPIHAPLLLVARMVRLAGEGFTPAEQTVATELRAGLEAIFPVALDRQTGILFRLCAAEPAAVPAPRRPVRDFLSFD